MPTTNTFVYTNTATTSLVTTAETAIMTMAGLSNRGPSDSFAIEGMVQLTPGTAATGVTLRVRRGAGVTGTVVGAPEILPVTAAVVTELGYQVQDSPGEVAGQVYTLTAQQTAATGNGSVTYVSGEVTLP